MKKKKIITRTKKEKGLNDEFVIKPKDNIEKIYITFIEKGSIMRKGEKFYHNYRLNTNRNYDVRLIIKDVHKIKEQ